MTASRGIDPNVDAEQERIEAQARDWVLGSGGDEAALARWRQADLRHERAWREASLAWSALGRSSQADGDAWRREAAGIRRGVLIRRLASGAAVAAGLAALVVAAPMLQRPAPVHYATGTAQTRELRLSDGSHVYVGARSALDVRLGGGRREVVLNQGEAFFEVAHDASRPFYVLAGKTRIRVVGTRFDITRVADGVRVSVQEGRVEVSARPLFPGLPPRDRHVLTGGEQIRAGAPAGAGGGTVTPVGPAEPGAWRDGRLLYADAPLSEVVADANRYSRRPIRLANAEIGELRVTATFRAGAIDDLLANLDQALPIRKQTQPDGAVLLSPDPAR